MTPKNLAWQSLDQAEKVIALTLRLPALCWNARSAAANPSIPKTMRFSLVEDNPQLNQDINIVNNNNHNPLLFPLGLLLREISQLQPRQTLRLGREVENLAQQHSDTSSRNFQPLDRLWRERRTIPKRISSILNESDMKRNSPVMAAKSSIQIIRMQPTSKQKRHKLDFPGVLSRKGKQILESLALWGQTRENLRSLLNGWFTLSFGTKSTAL